MMWEDKYKKANDAIHPSDELKKKTIQLMVQESEKKSSFQLWKVGLSFACCALIGLGIYQWQASQNESNEALFNENYVVLSDGSQIERATRSLENERAEVAVMSLNEPNGKITHDLFLDYYHSNSFDDNMLFSPVSTYFSLVNLANLSQNEALTNYLQVASLEEMNQEAIQLKQALVDEEKSRQIFDSIWVDDDLNYDKEVLQFLLDQLNVESYLVNFQDKQTSILMNQWIQDKTNHKISSFEVSQLGEVALYNTILLEENWISSFDEDQTYRDEFYGNEVSQVDYMQLSTEQKYFENETYQAVALSTLSNSEVWIILPQETVEIKDLPMEEIMALFEREIQTKPVHLSLPKFHLQTQVSLRNYLEQYVFQEEKASFIANLKVKDICQSNVLEIDEKGIEASSLTEVLLESAPILEAEKIIEMKVNRPFMMIVVDASTQTILYGGTIYQLTEMDS